MFRQGADLWREHNATLDAMEELVAKAADDPVLLAEMAKSTHLFVCDETRLRRRHLRARFGIKIAGSYPHHRMRVVDRERARPKALLEAAYQRDLLYEFLTFDLVRWAMGHAATKAYVGSTVAAVGALLAPKFGSSRPVPVPPPGGVARAVLCTYLYVMRNAPIAYAPLAQRGEGPPAQKRLQEAALGALSAWVRSRIRLYPSLRKVLAREGRPDEVLENEVPGEILAELSRLEALQSRPDDLAAHLDVLGKRGVYKFLVNRVSGNLRNPERAEHGKAGTDQRPDELELATFAEREALLRRGRDVGLPPREFELLKLLAENPKLSHREAARELGVAVSTAKMLRRNIRKTFEAV